MTSTTCKPHVNFPTDEGNGDRRSDGGGAGMQQQQQQQQPTTLFVGPDPSSSLERQEQQQHVCIICGDESDGLHFGQFTCRACAAFFRRTVSLKLHYICKRDGQCDMDKAARNICRACRYRKCLECGMLTSAVQHARDGIGKRTKSGQKICTSDMPDLKVPKEGGIENEGGDSGEQRQQRSSTPTSAKLVIVSSSSTAGPSTQFIQQATQAGHSDAGTLVGQQLFAIQPAQFMGGGTGGNGGFGVRQSPSLLKQTLYQLNVTSQFPSIQTVPQHQQSSNPLLVGQHFTNLLAGQPAMFSSSTTTVPFNVGGIMAQQQQQQQQQQQPSTCSVSLQQQQSELKYLNRMLEGYQHFMSLRKASYTLVEGFPLNQRDDEDCPQSNFGTSKKICKIEASLIMDTVDKFFVPFNELPTEDKHKMFDPFYCLFSNAERAFRTYKMFRAGDDRLLMPDGGYVRLSELQKFYENNTLVRGDPSQVARIFENAMHYLVKTVVAHMRNIELEEMELMTLFGMFIWNDSEEISSEAQQMAQRMRNEIILDLHLYYHSQGLSEANITLKTANLFLLIPKLEQSVRLMNDNFCISELFDMLSVTGACKRINRCALIGD